MSEHVKPIVHVSKCLGFANCRYNGQTVSDHVVELLKPFVEYHPVCPEVEIGLGVPRDPIRIIDTGKKKILYQPASGKEVTEEMNGFVNRYLADIGDVDGFLLKNRSPSCGPADVKVYKGMKKEARSGRGSGFFGDVVGKNFPHTAVEDEGRLKNFTIREHFYTKLFASARLRRMKADASMRSLVEFHSHNKYLLMAYNQSRLRELGRVVANHEKRLLPEVLALYERTFLQAFAKPPKFTSLINVLLHAFGGLSSSLQPEEKRFFLNSIEEFRDERIPLSTLNRLIEAWSIGQKKSYLLQQTFFRPFPKTLVEITDSGKGRKL
jgi:uncharacterized protein YbgA (DUF1722 family)/uncharacterized protein YbbK (DUF523 family)